MPKTYTTSQGDMWDMIAYKTLGSVNLTDRLMTANRKWLNVYIFPAGVVLDIPEIKPESMTEGLPPWKQTVG
ncbi:MAG: tail protein X [Oscillospiraceae bacterium]|nr:tail protein X [Oscillospiraceae bacterium]